MVAHGVIQNTMKRRSHGHLKHPDQTPWDRQDYFEHTKERGTTEKAPSWSWSSRRSRQCDLSDLSVLRQILRPGGYLRSSKCATSHHGNELDQCVLLQVVMDINNHVLDHGFHDKIY
jgi:hypothetical protein